MFTHWNWGWHGGDVYMRGWGLVVVLGAAVVLLGSMGWYSRKQHRR